MFKVKSKISVPVSSNILLIKRFLLSHIQNHMNWFVHLFLCYLQCYL